MDLIKFKNLLDMNEVNISGREGLHHRQSKQNLQEYLKNEKKYVEVDFGNMEIIFKRAKELDQKLSDEYIKIKISSDNLKFKGLNRKGFEDTHGAQSFEIKIVNNLLSQIKVRTNPDKTNTMFSFSDFIFEFDEQGKILSKELIEGKNLYSENVAEEESIKEVYQIVINKMNSLLKEISINKKISTNNVQVISDNEFKPKEANKDLVNEAIDFCKTMSSEQLLKFQNQLDLLIASKKISRENLNLSSIISEKTNGND